MTLRSDTGRADLSGGRPRSGFSGGLNALGIAVVAFWFVVNGIQLHHPVWVWVLGTVALAGWALREFGRAPRLLAVAGVVMIAAGSVTAAPTYSLMIVPVIVGIVVLGADLRLPVWVSAIAGVAAIVVIAAFATAEHMSVQFVLGTSAGVLLGVLIGFSRRQFRIAEQQARAAEEEQQHARLLADRSRAARDIHDVLAHSLGGLVLQLDAVEALLEAGRIEDATKRAGDARTLAADGLAEARRAVRALREDTDVPDSAVAEPAGPAAAGPGPDAPTEATVSADAGHASRPADETGLTALVDAHRSFGGAVVVQGDATLSGLDARHRAAVVQVVREALSNARRHAPGVPVSLSVVRDGDAVDVVVANALTSGGHGLIGMRERIAELGSGATLETVRSDDEFVVAVHLPAADGPRS